MWKLPSLRNGRRVPKVPEGIRIYAVGDVHGRADLLALLLSQIEVDIILHPVSHPTTVFLGDYVDRGSASKDVLDLLVERRRRPGAVFLKGNHEDLFLKFLKDAAVLDVWRHCGGLETLVAYGLRPPINPGSFAQVEVARDLDRVLPDEHREFLMSLQLSFVCGDFLFVHAGVRPLVPIDQQAADDLLWIRDEFLLWEREFEKIVVHGHTPVQEPDIRFNRINIDTGAFATGRLTCMVIEGTAIIPLDDVRAWVARLAEAKPEPFAGARKGVLPAEGSRPHLAALAASAVRRLKEGVAADDKSVLARLDPRPRT